jgi:hypothetical protein
VHSIVIIQTAENAVIKSTKRHKNSLQRSLGMIELSKSGGWETTDKIGDANMTIQAKLFVGNTPLQGSADTQAALAALFMMTPPAGKVSK